MKKQKGFVVPLIIAIVAVLIVGGGYFTYNKYVVKSSDTVPKLIGGDKDEHGCLGPAGYSWCEVKQKCLRTWEEKCETTAIADQTKDWKTYTNTQYGFEIKYPADKYRSPEIINVYPGSITITLEKIGTGQSHFIEIELWDSKESFNAAHDYILRENPTIKEIGGKIISFSDKTEVNTIESIISTVIFTTPANQTANWKTYTNSDYGFQITLPDSWKGYTVTKQTWQGWAIDGGNKTYSGPEIIIKNPNTTAQQTYQDIPIIIFTREQWGPDSNTPGVYNPAGFSISAAPIGPAKIGENSKYVFATPPRWYGFTNAIGWQVAVDATKTFKALITR